MVSKEGELVKYESDRLQIGGTSSREESHFTTEEIIAEKGTMLYMTTDGFQDQANEKEIGFL